MLNARSNYLYVFILCLAILLAACSGAAGAMPVDNTPLPGKVAIRPATAEATQQPTLAFTKPTEAAPVYPTAALKKNTKNECSPGRLDQSVLLGHFGQGRSTHLLSAIDPLSGRPLCDYPPISAGLDATLKLSPDQRTLAMVISRENDHSDGVLHLVDLENWHDVETSVEIMNWVSQMTFSPNGRYLAIAYLDPEADETGWPKKFVLDLVDVTKQHRLATQTLDMAPRLMEFSADGQSLMVYGVANQDRSGIDAQARAVLLDSADLEVTWELALERVRDGQTRLYGSDGSESYAWWGPAAVLSADQQALYIVHADEDVLTTVDFGRRSTKSVEIQPPRAWFERLLALTAGVAQAKMVDGTTKQAALSADGQRLYIAGQTNDTWQDENGNWQFTQTPLGLQVVDVSTGTEIAHLETEGTQLAPSQDARRLFLHGWSQTTTWTEVVDLESMAIETRLTGRWVVPARRLNGEPVLVSAVNQSAQTVLAALDADTLEEVNKWWVGGYAEWVVE